MHFTRMGDFGTADVPIIVRGDGCYLEDADGRRYIDALAGLFSVNIGYSFGEEIGQAALEQMRELPFYTNWSYAHPRAIELAAEVASLAPGDLNRVFFCSGGSEAVESASRPGSSRRRTRSPARRRQPVLPGATSSSTAPMSRSGHASRRCSAPTTTSASRPACRASARRPTTATWCARTSSREPIRSTWGGSTTAPSSTV